MRVCDRCKKEMKSVNEIKLAKEKFEICNKCSEYISNHIKKFDSKKGLLSGLMN